LDGVHFVSETEQSKLTFMIYLNGSEDFEGGRTLFFNSKEADTIIGSYCPQKGDLIVFDHNLWHSGETVRSGEKYILRSDIIYQKAVATSTPKSAFCGEGHLGYIWAAIVFNGCLITSGRDKKIKVWSQEGSKLFEGIGHQNSVISLIGMGNKTLVSASRDMSIKIWKWQETANFSLLHTLNYHEATVLCLCKINDNEFFSGGADGLLNRINLNGHLLDQTQAHQDWIWAIDTLGKNYCVTVSEDGSLKIWGLSTLHIITFWQGEIPVNALVVEGNVIYIGQFDGTVLKFEFDPINHQLQLVERSQCHTGIIRSMVIDEQFLYTASEDNTLKVWDKNTLTPISSFKHQNFVQDIALFDQWVISVSYDGKIRKHAKAF